MEPNAPTPPVEGCPVCGGAVAGIHCKLICRRCGALVSNCNGD